MNMIYNASAGTGKTWQVTELYSALVLGRPHEELPAGRKPIDPRRILLMTFTDNAAAELRQRVAERMLSAQQDEDVDRADCARRVLRTLPAANISTIHAFCAGLLREHALEIGLSPSFQTLEDEERNALLDDVLKAEIFQCLDSKRSERGFAASRRGNDQREWQPGSTGGPTVLQGLEENRDFRDFCAGISVLNGDYSLLSTVRSLLEKADSRGLDLSTAEAMLPEPKQTISEDDFQKIYKQLAAIDAERGLPAKAAGVFQTLEKILQKVPTSKALATEVPIAGNPPRPSIRSGHPSGGGEWFESPPAEGCPQGGVGLELIRQLTKFTGKGMKEISDELAEVKERFLTEHHYEQNIGKFRAFARCLARCATAFAEAKRARDVVDFGDQILLARDLLEGGEFNNLFDWIIVDEVQDTSRVQCDLIESIWGPETNLVVCGDRKQSIYAWRSADPNVMPDLEAAMAERGNCKKIDLKISYRSKERVIEAVNELFEGIYESYDALEPLTSQADEIPCVEFLMQETEEDGVEEEMAAVARRIRLLVDGGEEWKPKFGHDGERFVEGEPFHYGDVLILLKRSTHQAVLEKALRAAGIPYTSGGKGRGLFEKQEVRDLLLFLQVITQPQNDLALVGFLRSPFANVPDETIVELGWDGETFDREILRKQFFEGGSEVAERILRFRTQVGLKPPSQLVRDLVRETAFDAHWAGRPAGEQHLANFKKALDWLRKAERGGQVLIGDVVRRFEKYIQASPRSGAAEALLPDPEQNAVTLMTVHGAKGLTKRACFVPDISFGDTSESGFAALSPKGKLEMSLSGLAGEKIKSPGWVAAREADKAVRKLEQDNVFYVAMTRARDLVVLSGAGTKKPNGWLKQAADFLESASTDILKKRCFSEIPEMAGKDLRPEAAGCRDDFEFHPLEISKGLERKPVTSLVEHLKPKAYGLKPSNDRRSFGTLGHLILEELARCEWGGDIPELVGRFSEEISVDTERLIEQLEAAREVLRKETAGAEALFIEHPFVLKRDSMILDGTIDLLAKFGPSSSLRAGGRWKILDYKFSNESPEAALEAYSPQLAAYREAVEKLNPAAEVSASLVLIGKSVNVLQL